MRRFLPILMCTMLFTPALMVTSAHATEYSLQEMTPEVTLALSSRKARFDQLELLKAKGIIGENNRGYVEVLVDDVVAADIALSENEDREMIYQTIAQQNGITDQIATIEKVFAQVQHEKAGVGYKIQDSTGKWKEK